jgi:hypothetical protein
MCLPLAAAIGVLFAPSPARADSADVETIVLLRHGEKPEAGLGQLSCQGLNRALALPRVIESRYGKPDVIFAPDPAQQKSDLGQRYDYVRPLATIEPTAIYFGMPVNASLGVSQTEDLRQAVLAPAYRRSVVVVAWEHVVLEKLAQQIVAQYGGDPATVPWWHSRDFDSIYVLRISRLEGRTQVAFSTGQQGLNGLSTRCPGG